MFGQGYEYTYEKKRKTSHNFDFVDRTREGGGGDPTVKYATRRSFYTGRGGEGGGGRGCNAHSRKRHYSLQSEFIQYLGTVTIA